ncbi:MAG: winged helix-turn-helix domain-containing protein [Deltaproteobacteria bacterium]|nr:winged helix-turn-helix domain-containing protein [Deltaproteobacteria bacterium]
MSARDPSDGPGHARRGAWLARAAAAVPGRARPGNAVATITIDESAVVIVAALRVDGPAQRATLADRVLELTRMELRLLTAFAQHAGRVLRVVQIAQAVWGPDASDHVRSVRGYVARLRLLLEDDPARPRWLVTRRRVGYCLRREPAPA